MTPRTPRTSGSGSEFELEARATQSNPADFRLGLPPPKRRALGSAAGIGSSTHGLRQMRRVTADGVELVGIRATSQLSE